MVRTTLLLPPDLKDRAERRARRLGISFGEIVRRSLRDALEREPPFGVHDSLFSDDAVFRGDVPSEVSSGHDESLYGEARR